MEINVTEQILIYLLNCAANNKVPENLPEDTDYEELFKISRFHSVTAMVAYALDAGGYLSENYMPQVQIKEWAAARIGAMRKNILFDVERKEIFRFMEEQGCWYMPLKGVVLKEMYPDVGMRQMADNDILFNREFRVPLRDYMISRGYEVDGGGEYINDVYLKKPFFNFECHVDLFCKRSNPEWALYYEGVKDKLKKDENSQYGYRFSDEDFYIYLTAHACKHYRAGGTGIRSLADIYVYLSKKNDSMDWEYICRELKVLGIYEFEQDARVLTGKLFRHADSLSDQHILNEQEKKMLSYIMGSGTYGTVSNQMKNTISLLQSDETKITNWTKVKLCFQKIFPGLDYMKNCEPFFYQHKWLIPFFWVYRILRAPFRNRGRILAELRAIMNIK